MKVRSVLRDKGKDCSGRDRVWHSFLFVKDLLRDCPSVDVVHRSSLPFIENNYRSLSHVYLKFYICKIPLNPLPLIQNKTFIRSSFPKSRLDRGEEWEEGHSWGRAATEGTLVPQVGVVKVHERWVSVSDTFTSTVGTFISTKPSSIYCFGSFHVTRGIQGPTL